MPDFLMPVIAVAIGVCILGVVVLTIASVFVMIGSMDTNEYVEVDPNE